MSKSKGIVHYIKKRLLITLIVLFGVSILSFLLVAAAGRDAAEIVARRNSMNVTNEMIEQVRYELGLDKSIPIRYINWIIGLFCGDLGRSLTTFNPVATDLAKHLPSTLGLVALSLGWTLLLTLPTSLLCAHKKGSVFDHSVRIISIVGICLPTFFLGLLLVLAFAVQIPIFSVAPSPGIRGYILPSFTLAFPTACAMVRVLRSSILAELHKDYVMFAKTCGLSKGQILRKHIFRNALPPFITLFCQHLGYLVAGSVVVETVFSLPGIGGYLLACVLSADTTPIASCIMLIALVFVIANFTGDIVNQLLCPWMVKEAND